MGNDCRLPNEVTGNYFVTRRDTDMSKSERPNHDTRMTVTVRGREVAMQFTEKPNPQVALQVKQALMGNYLAASSK